MRIFVRLFAGTLAILPALFGAHAENQQLRLELNTVESVQNRCRMTFLIENKRDQAIESFKLDLVVLDTNNTMQRRTLIELAPIRQSKTMIRTFDIEQDCGKIGSILVNDVTACSPGDAATCLDQLALSSRVSGIRIFK
jgi:hypothetical protein